MKKSEPAPHFFFHFVVRRFGVSRTLLAAAAVAVLTLAGCASAGTRTAIRRRHRRPTTIRARCRSATLPAAAATSSRRPARPSATLARRSARRRYPLSAARRRRRIWSDGHLRRQHGPDVGRRYQQRAGQDRLDARPGRYHGGQSSGDVIRSAGVTVGNAEIVSDLGAAGSPLAPLNPVTSPVGSGVSALGQVMQGAGGLVTIGTSSGPVQQITQQTSNAIVPLSSQVAQGTQAVGSTTMLGGPLAGALNTGRRWPSERWRASRRGRRQPAHA